MSISKDREHSLQSRLLSRMMDRTRAPIDMGFADRLAQRIGIGSPWQWVMEEEHRLKEVLAPLGETDDTDARREAAKEWWAHVHKALWIYAREICQPSGGVLTPPPGMILFRLAGMAEYLAGGIMPEPVSDVTSKGRTKIADHPDMRRSIQFASAYLLAVRTGRLSDRHPVKTVAEAYGVDHETARRWGKINITAQMRMLLDYNPSRLVHSMKHEGTRYSMWGPGAGAVVARARKRKSQQTPQ